MKYIIALDQGTTSSRALLFNAKGRLVGSAQKELGFQCPHPGWVEQDPSHIWGSQSGMARELVETSGVDLEDVVGIGIANQRETTIVWDKQTGKPIYPAIVWQCRRTAAFCDELISKGHDQYISEATGLVVDSYFSATKLHWILEHVEGARSRAERGELLFGTVDTWLIWNLTKGRVHATDYSNASRTMLFNIHTLDWDQKILDLLGIPRCMLPNVNPSSAIYGYTDEHNFGRVIPIAGVAGDQQAALFGQTCFDQGSVKNTYGTGCFLLMNTGAQKVRSKTGLLTTIAWHINGETTYALEGSIFNAGASINWLIDGLGIISKPSETEILATQVDGSNGVYMVPAFTGLGAPYWDMYARGMLIGLTRDTNKAHIARATLEAIAYQTKDVIEAMQNDSGIQLKELRVDGGATKNKFLLQFQADLLGVDVLLPAITESTGMGAAFLAGLGAGLWHDLDELKAQLRIDTCFIPSMAVEVQQELYAGWKKAVNRTKDWCK